MGLRRSLFRGGIGLLGCAGVLAGGPAPAAGAEEATAMPETAAEEMALMELYFGKEQMVEAATRHPKPISQIAENVTVVTAEEIEAMHAHTVDEVLERVSGVFVTFAGRDFASTSSATVHGSDYEHVLVLVDGIRWNDPHADFPETNQIPVEIIDRIEVIKGAASSAWGSALGGVVNIITKQAGTTSRPHGSAAIAVGEYGTNHEHGEAAGGAGDFGYYLFAGRRESDGIRDDRYFDDRNLFGKLSYRFRERTRLTAEIGYSEPEFKYLHYVDPDPAWSFGSAKDERILWYAASLDSSLSDDIHFFFQAYGNDFRMADTGSLISTGEIWDKLSYDNEQRGVNSRLAWEEGRHTLVLGAEYLDREVTPRDEVNDLTAATLSEEILAVYLNDTIRLGDFTVTPGLRYDHLSIADDEISPSLGATWRLSSRTLLRAAVSRGFRKPVMGLKELAPGDPPYNTPNPQLESETIVTYQAGAETTAIPWLWLQATLFRHKADDIWVQDEESWAWVNDGEMDRTGLELALKTVPIHNFSLGANYVFVHLDPDSQESDDLYKVNLLLEYDNRDRGLLAQLFGNYVWWSDVDFSPPEEAGKFDTFIWDFTLHQRLQQFTEGEVDLFFKVHNLFNGSHYWTQFFPNAPRWLEGGLQVRF